MARPLKLMQWNCRGLPKKKGELQAWLAKQNTKPDIVALQEPGKAPNITGYTTHQDHPNIAILTSKKLLAHKSSSDEYAISLQLGPQKQALLITNVYSPPKHQLQDIDQYLQPQNSKQTHILLGDFNAPHTAWGYHKDSKKGAILAKHTTARHYVLHNDLLEPTRHGNSVETHPRTSRSQQPDYKFDGATRENTLGAITTSYC